MSELQKLSFKKLKKRSLPLFVIDQKSKKKVFVILDYESFSKLQSEHPPPLQKQKPRISLSHYDFKAKGLFWDRPNLSNKEFISILKNPEHPEYTWAISRLLERLPSQEVLKLFSLATLHEILKRAKIRDFIRRPWEHALSYFRQKTSSDR